MTDNERIAKFMGLIRREANETYNKAQYWLPQEDKRYKGQFVGYHDTLQYHEFWDWLMPVVDIIEQSGYIVEMWDNKCFVRHPSAETMVSEISKHDAAYKAVVEFIKWFETREE